MPEPAAWISAMKPAGADRPHHLTSCAFDDKDATHFRISYPGMRYSSSTIDFAQEDYATAGAAKYRAENVRDAIALAFAAGKRAYARELRAFMGISE